MADAGIFIVLLFVLGILGEIRNELRGIRSALGSDASTEGGVE